MKDKSSKILLEIPAGNLTLQTIIQIGLFPTTYAQSGAQKIAISDINGQACAEI